MKEDEIGGACSTYRQEERCIQGLVGNPEEKRPRRRHRRRLEANKGIDLKKVRRGFVDWTELAENIDNGEVL